MALKLNYHQFGRGEPLVILHGLFGSSRNWQSMAKRLAEQYCVYTLDIRNHGKSPHAEDMAYADMAADVVELMSQLQLGPVNLLGHSMGGKLAMHIALSHKDLIASLLIADIAPVRYPNGYTSILAAMNALPLEQISRRLDADKRLRADIPDDQLRLFLLQNLIVTQGTAKWQLNVPAIIKYMPEILGELSISADRQFHGPTFFITGALSNYVKNEHHSRIREYFPNCQFRAIEQAGHWLHAEQPDAFYTAVTSALTDKT